MIKNFQKRQCRWQIVLVCFAAMLGASCGGGMQQATSNTTTSSTGSKDASLSLNETSIAFGSIAVGSSKSSSLTLTNSSAAGGPDVTFSEVKATGAGFAATTAALPIVLTPGQSSTISITFAPKASGAVTGSLAITVAGAANPASVPLSGTGLGPSELGVSPTSLSFGSVTVGSSLSKTATLTAGDADIKVASAAWSGSGYSVSGISFPVTVAAGKSISFKVTFTPGSTGASSGSVTFVSNAANTPTVEKFSGTGAAAQSSQTPPADQHTVELNWDPSSSSVIGYYTYRGTTSGGPYSKLNSSPSTNTAFSDDTVDSGKTYYYVVTSVDSEAVESSYSNQVVAIVPGQ